MVKVLVTKTVGGRTVPLEEVTNVHEDEELMTILRRYRTLSKMPYAEWQFMVRSAMTAVKRGGEVVLSHSPGEPVKLEIKVKAAKRKILGKVTGAK